MDQSNPIGDYTIFGFTPDPGYLLQHCIPNRLEITPRRLDFGSYGSLFFHSTYADIAETDDAVCIKLGFLRSPDKSMLSAQKLLFQGIVRPGFLDHNQVRGNALIVCLGKKKSSISALKTLLGIPQLYYAQVDGGLICSDRLKCIVALLDHVELNEDIVPMHFLFRSTPGEFTYYRQIRRLLPGGFFNWVEGKLTQKIVKDFCFTNDPDASSRKYGPYLDNLYETLLSVVGDYIVQAEGSGRPLATLLSGGVDSSLLQYLVNQKTFDQPARSYSFAINAPSFAFEIDYAKESAQLFHTEHTFVEFQPEDFPGLLTRAVDELAQPPILETEPSMLSIAEYAHAVAIPYRYFVSGQGADGLFGLALDRKLKSLQVLQQIPAGAFTLRVLGALLKPAKSISSMLHKGSAILASADAPDAFVSPSNSIAVYTDLYSEHSIIRRCFGDDVLHRALHYRRDLAAQYLGTDHYLEKVHMIDLVTDAYEVSAQRQQLFLANQREQLHPFLDDDVLHAGFQFHPDMRYIKGLRKKYLLKELLEQKTGSLAARKPKGASIFELDLYAWMSSGPLRPLVEEIDLPGYISRAELNRLIEQPNYFLWELLTFDVFRRRCLT